MLEKRKSKTKDVVEVTFILPPEDGVNSAHLLGEFNNWQATQSMERDPDGNWRITLKLKANQAYQFRYLLNNEHWANDPQADGCVANDYGSENSVVNTQP